MCSLTETARWPGGRDVRELRRYLLICRSRGAELAVTDFKGRLFDGNGAELPGGTVVEAYIGDALCGLTSLRYGDATEGIYTMMVAGPKSVSGCDIGATITFLVDGIPATETLPNDPDAENLDEVNLTQTQ